MERIQRSGRAISININPISDYAIGPLYVLRPSAAGLT